MIIHPACLTVEVDGVTHRPSRRVWLLIRYLSGHPGHVRSWDQIADAMGAVDILPSSVASAVRHARKIVGERIGCRYGMGYSWDAPKPEVADAGV